MNAPTKIETVNVHEAKTHFSRLLARAEAGEEIIVARAGRPVAKLVPMPVDPVGSKPSRRTPGRLAHIKLDPETWFEPMSEDELAAWEGKYSNIV